MRVWGHTKRGYMTRYNLVKANGINLFTKAIYPRESILSRSYQKIVNSPFLHKTNIYLKCNGLNSLGLFTIQGWELDVKQSLMSIRTSESIQISTHHNSLSSKVKIQTKTITKFNLHAIYYKTHSQLNMRTTINHWNHR